LFVTSDLNQQTLLSNFISRNLQNRIKVMNYALWYPNKGGGLSIRTSSDKICSDSEPPMGGSWNLNLDKSYQNSETEATWYPNRGGVSVSKLIQLKFVRKMGWGSRNPNNLDTEIETPVY